MKRQAPTLTASRLLVVVTGAASAAFAPFWVNWVRENYPDVSTRVALTRSATRFVTPATLSMLSGLPVVVDAWPESPWPQTAAPTALHVELAEWAEAIVVYPATAHFVARFALGLADTPVLLAAQITDAVIGVAPAVPPGMTVNPAFTGHLAALAARRNVVVAPTVTARSVTTGRREDGGAGPLWTALELIESRRAELAAAP